MYVCMYIYIYVISSSSSTSLLSTLKIATRQKVWGLTLTGETLVCKNFFFLFQSSPRTSKFRSFDKVGGGTEDRRFSFTELVYVVPVGICWLVVVKKKKPTLAVPVGVRRLVVVKKEKPIAS